MLALARDRVVQAGGRLEHEAALAARADEARELLARERAPPQRTFARRPELDELVEPLVERVVERRLDVDLGRRRDARDRPERAVSRRPPPSDLRERGVQDGAHAAPDVRELAEPRRRADEPAQHERGVALPRAPSSASASGSSSDAGGKSGAWSISRSSSATRASSGVPTALDLRRGAQAALRHVR